MKMNRALQREVLVLLEESSPNTISIKQQKNLVASAGSKDILFANLRYLEGHGLIASGLEVALDGFYLNVAALKITSKGIDFLLEDGGLGTILNTVTVKIHDDSVARIEQFLAQSSLSPQDKTEFASRLKSLPAVATEHFLLKILDLGLENAPEALRIIQTTLGG